MKDEKSGTYESTILKYSIELSNIGNITICNSNIQYSTPEDVSGLSTTTIELPNIPKGSSYGWDHINNVWVYYINNAPLYYSNYNC